MNIRPIHSSTPADAGVPIEQLAANKSLTEQEKLHQASRQFEAIVLRQILGQARKQVFHSKVDQESTGSGIYQDMVTGQLADAISQSGSFGLARSLQTQLDHQALPPAHPAGPAPVTPPKKTP